MNTPKRDVSWLENFPPDIWACFVSYIPGEQLGRLKMTGARLLSQRLKSPNVVKSIQLGRDFIVFKSCPRFLYDFPSLEKLSFNSVDEKWSTELGLTLDSLPSGLRQLKFDGEWEESSAELFIASGAPLKLHEHLPRLEVLDLRWLNLSSYSWMVHSPQSLTTLKIASWDGTVELPSSLIHFKTGMAEISKASFVSKLPSALESFQVELDTAGVDLIVALLPPSTRQLSFGQSVSYYDELQPQQNFLERLPNFLTWLKVPSLPEINFETNPELSSLLSPTLTELRIYGDFPCPAWPFLPQQLTRLTIQVPIVSKTRDNLGTQQQVTSIPFDSLPRSITSLTIYFNSRQFCGPPPKSNQSYFPPQLTQLKTPNLHLSPETAKLLPSSLTHLEVGNLCEQICEHLPRGIKTLNVSSILMTPNLIKFLPKSLTSLHSSIPSSSDAWFDCNTGESIDFVSELPEYSSHELCFLKKFDWKSSSSLPSTLTVFDLSHDDDIKDSFIKHHRLPNLLKLRLSDSEHLSNDSIRFLSPHLTVLDLPSSSQIGGKSFQHLPRYLIFLNLNESESIFDSEIQHLPRTLKRTYLGSAIHLTDLCVLDLPPHLELLYLSQNHKITPSSFPHFPYSIRSSKHHSTADFANWDIHRGSVRHK